MSATYSIHLENDLSPNAMADKAFAAGIADRKRRNADDRTRSENKRVNVDTTRNAPLENFETTANDRDNKVANSGLDTDLEPEKQLESFWNRVTLSSILVTTPQDDGHIHESKLDESLEKVHGAAEATSKLVQVQLENFFREGLEAFHKCDSLLRELNQAKELCDARGKELLRLQTSESESKHLVSNLLRAVEASKADSRDAVRAAHEEARLRGELTTLRLERDEALGTKAEALRKSSLLEEEVKLLKEKVNRLIQEKIKVERDSRAALSLARSMDNHVSADTEFYKRKVTELNDVIQAKNATIADQSHQIEEYRRQIDRNMSQNRLSQMRSENSKTSATNQKSA